MDSYTLHVETEVFSNTTRRHKQNNCILSAEETVLTQERRWKTGIYPDIRLHRLKNVSEEKSDSKEELLP